MTKIVNPSGAFGYTDTQDNNWQNQVPFKAGAAVTAGNLVSFNTSGEVIPTATDGTPHLVVGMAVNSISSGAVGLVAIQGVVDGLVADGTIAAAAILKRSVNTTGAVAATATPGAGEVIGVAIAASSGGFVKAWINKSVATS